MAQLPTMLKEDLGLERDEDATAVFQQSSMESILDELGEGGDSPASRTKDYFANMTFGPLANGVFAASAAPSPFAGPGLEKRRPSYLGLTDWPLSAGAIGGGRPEFFDDVEDYFGEATQVWPIPKALGSQRISRRHSMAGGDACGIEEHFQQLGFGSAGKEYGGGGLAGQGYHHGYLMHSGEFDGYPPAHGPGLGEHAFQLNSYTGPLWAVEFKSGRTEIFYVLEADGAPQFGCKVGDLVIVEADRGEDLGKVTAEISVARMKSYISAQAADERDSNEISTELAALLRSKEIIPKRIHRLAQASDLKLLQAKSQEEALAMVRCQSRIRQKKLPMEVVDAEYQWDRNKLTFFFVADRRIDFRELVRDLFRIYKTRIWMCAVDKTSPRMINYLGGLVPVHSNEAR